MDNVTLSRAIMGTSLGFHIVFAVLGVGMPLLMFAAEGIGLWRHDPVWLALARRWAKAFALIFAIGAVSGTALSFELGLLWPGFMAFSGSVIGLPFSAEGFAFFIEAIFLGLYLYGWDRLGPVAHWLTGVPIAISGAASSVFVVMVNAWMNSPTGYQAVGNRIVRVDPLAAAFNPSTPTEDVHMLVSAYLVSGFAVAAVYAAGFRELQSQVGGQPANPHPPKLKSLQAVTANMQVASSEEVRRVEKGMSWLATTGSVAPFVGLFGTVWGIIDAFSGLGNAGAASLRAVAPGISEALLTTAAGLATAIPAVIFYNQFLQNIKDLAQRLDTFTLEVSAQIEKTFS